MAKEIQIPRDNIQYITSKINPFYTRKNIKKTIIKYLVNAGTQKGLYFVPINFLYNKKPIDLQNAKETYAKWGKNTFTDKDFKEGYNIALNLGKSNIVCIDIDSKEEKGFTQEHKKAIDNLVRTIKSLKIPIDKSLSGEGYHIYLRLTKEQEQLFRSKFKEFNSTQSYLAKDLEIKTGNMLAILPPSNFEDKQAHYINSDILNIDYLDDKELEQLTDIILHIASICGNYKSPQQTINETATRNNLKPQDEKLYKRLINNPQKDEAKGLKQFAYNFIPNDIREQLNIINGLYFTITKVNRKSQEPITQDIQMQLERRLEKVLQLLDKLGIQTYKITQEKRINIRSLFFDDGKHPDAYIYANDKQVIYFDFHDYNYKGNLLYNLYIQYPDKLLNALKELYPYQFIEPTPTIYINDKKDLLPTILKQLETNNNILIHAPTGYGKTTKIKKLSKRYKILLIEPLTTQLEQEHKNYEPDIDKVCFYAGNPTDPNNLKHQCIIATAAQVREHPAIYKELAKDRIVVIDEAHNPISDVSYREKDIQAINEILKIAKHTIYMTATIRFTGLESFVDVIIKVNPEPKENRFIQRCLVDGKIKTIEGLKQEIIHDAKKYPEAQQMVLVDNKETLNLLREQLEPILKKEGIKKDIKVITANEVRQNPELTSDITKDGIIKNKDIILTTRKLSLGINIYNAGTIIFYTIDNDVNIIEQFINRVRHYDKEGNRINNTVICKLFTKKIHNYFDYDKLTLSLIYEKKETYKDIEVKEGYKGNPTIKRLAIGIATGNDFFIHNLDYGKLVTISRHNDTYILTEIKKTGWQGKPDKKITYADKIKTLGKDKPIEQFKPFYKQVYEIIETKYKPLLNSYDETLFNKFKKDVIKQKLNRKKFLERIETAIRLERLKELTPIVEKANTMRNVNSHIAIWNDMEIEENTNTLKLILDYVNSNSIKVNNKQIITIKDINDKFKPGTIKPTSFIDYVLQKAGYQKKAVKFDKQVVKCFVKQS